MATIGVGYVYTTGVTSPLQISPDTKRAALRGAAAMAGYRFATTTNPCFPQIC